MKPLTCYTNQLFSHRVIFFGSFLLLANSAATGWAQTEVYDPIAFGTNDFITFAPDPRWDVGDERTLEIQLTGPDRADASNCPAVMPVLSLGEGSDADYRVTIRKKGHAIGIRFPRAKSGRGGSATCDFTDGNFHQVAFITRYGQTKIVIDGKEVTTDGSTEVFTETNETGVTSLIINGTHPVFQIPSGSVSPVPLGQSLYLGSDGLRTGFTGQLRTVRLWNKALTTNELNWASQYYGLPEATNSVYSNLVAYSFFTDLAQEMAFTEPEIQTLPLDGAAAGRMFSALNPPGRKLHALYLRQDSGGIKEICAEFSTPGQIPVLRPQPTTRDTNQLAIIQMVLRQTNSFNSTALESLTTQLRKAELGINVSPSSSWSYGMNPLANGWSVFWIPEGANLDTLAATHNGGALRTLRFIGARQGSRSDSADKIDSHVFGATADPGLSFFAQQLPDGMQGAGLVWKANNHGYICAIGLAGQPMWTSDLDQQRLDLTEGEWIDRDERLPQHDDQSDQTRPLAAPKLPDFVLQRLGQQLVPIFMQLSTIQIIINAPNQIAQNLLAELRRIGKTSDAVLNRLASPSSAEDFFNSIGDSITQTFNVTTKDTPLIIDMRQKLIDAMQNKTNAGPMKKTVVDLIMNGKGGVGKFISTSLSCDENNVMDLLPHDTILRIVSRNSPLTPSETDLLASLFFYGGDDTTTTSLSAGNYTTPSGYNFLYHHGENIVEMYWAATNHERLSYLGDNIYASGNHRLVVDDDGLWLADLRGHSLKRLIRPAAYEEGGDDKLPWGATFSLNERPTLVKSNFRGYNIKRMDPRNFQSDSGADQLLFHYPEEASKDYSTTDNKVIVPHGLHYRADNVGTENASTEIVTTSEGYAHSWSTHLGASVGGSFDGFGASASVNAKWGGSIESMTKNSSTRAICRTVQTRYALVLDEPRMPLSDVFVNRILRLRDRLLAYGSLNTNDFARFFDSFGTHYAYAVTYGGMAIMEKDYTQSDLSSKTTSDWSIDADASVTAEGFTAGVSGGHSETTGNSSEYINSKEHIHFKAYGGSISSGEGWTLPRGEEVPVYLDLRPIYELLSPGYFTDARIWNEVGPQLATEWRTYLGVKP